MHILSSGSLALLSVLVGIRACAQTELFPGRNFSLPSTTSDSISADFDNDGRPDLVFAHASATANISVLRNLGAGTYSAPIQMAVPGLATCLGKLDVDSDGNLDLIVGVHASGSVPSSLSILRGNGDCTFQPLASIAVPSDITVGRLAIGDFDNDGRPDFVLATSAPGDYYYYFRNLGFGVFAQGQQRLLPGSQTSQLLAADFDNDAKLDLLFVRGVPGVVTYLRNLGNATFAAPASYATAANAGQAAIADIDLDNDLDIIVAANPVAKLIRNVGNSAFDDALDIVGAITNSIVLTDLNADGNLDLIGTGRSSSGEGVCVCYNNGSGAFGAPNVYSIGDYGGKVFLVDHDGDGDQDVSVLSSVNVVLPQSVVTAFNIGNGVFYTRNDYAVARFPRYVAVGDIDGDTFPDIASVGYADNTGLNYLTLLSNLNQGSGNFGNRRDITVPTGRSVCMANMDGDADIDLVIGSSAGVGVFLNDGLGTFAAPTRYSDLNNVGIDMADIDNDGDQDLIGFANVTELRIRKNNGAGALTTGATYQTAFANLIQSESGDFNHDGFPDIVVASNSNVIAYFQNLGNGTFTATPRNISSIQFPYSIAVADLNQDEHLDFVVACSNDLANSQINQWGSIAIHFGRGDGTFLAPVYLSTFSNPYFVTCGDVDGDNLPDIVSGNSETRVNSNLPTRSTISVIRNAGNGGFRPSINFNSRTAPYCVALTDINNDQNLDIVAANYFPTATVTATVSVFKANPVAPTITLQPQPQTSCIDSSATFQVAAAALNPRTFQWRKNGQPIDPVLNPSAAAPSLQLTSVQASDAATYDCIITNPRGSITSAPALLTVCAADFNCDAVVDFFDYLDFVSAFSASDPSADFNHDSVIDFFDYLDFVAAFSEACA